MQGKTINNAEDFYLEPTLFSYNDDKQLKQKLVAKVLVNITVSHIDQLYDYEVPDNLSDKLKFGSVVRIKFGGKNTTGWVISTQITDKYHSRIKKIISVDSNYSLLTPNIYNLCKKVAQRYIANTAQILNFAIVDRKSKTESAFVPKKIPYDYDDTNFTQAVAQYNNGQELLEKIVQSQAVKATLKLKPYYGSQNLSWAYTILQLALTTAKTGRQTIVLLPNTRYCNYLYAVLAQHFTTESIAVFNSEDKGSVRFENYLKALSQQAHIVIGTQNAIFAPLQSVGLIVCFDDANSNYELQSQPYMNMRQVAIQRSIAENTALVLAGFNKSVEMRYLENIGWSVPVDITPIKYRKYCPKIIFSSILSSTDPYQRISDIAYSTIKKGLETGPVLIQVGMSGYYSKIVCENCAWTAVCLRCQHLVSRQSDNSFTCTNCARVWHKYHCLNCRGDKFKAVRSGNLKTAKEIGKAFADTPILISSKQNRIDGYIDDRPRIVIATAGAEPIALSGYCATVILDIDTLYNMPIFNAQTESFRRWFCLLGLTRPEGTVVIDGTVEEEIALAIQSGNFNTVLDSILSQRKQLQLPPYARFVKITGSKVEVSHLLKQVAEAGFEVMGITMVNNSTAVGLCRTTIKNSAELLKTIKAQMQIRSLRGEPKLKIDVDPIQLW